MSERFNVNCELGWGGDIPRSSTVEAPACRRRMENHLK